MHTLSDTSFFFFNDPATPEIFPLSLPDALPICPPPGEAGEGRRAHRPPVPARVLLPCPLERPGRLGRQVGGLEDVAVGLVGGEEPDGDVLEDRKSTRLNSSHDQISYAVFCLKKK